MSAGNGIAHSEKNHNKDQEVKFLQIWVYPNKNNVPPRYEQKSFDESEKSNQLATIVSPVETPSGGVNIYQDAWFSMGKLDKGTELSYQIHKKGNGVYAFVLEGDLTIEEITLQRRDGLGISEAEKITLKADDDAEILLMEVPMK